MRAGKSTGRIECGWNTNVPEIQMEDRDEGSNISRRDLVPESARRAI